MSDIQSQINAQKAQYEKDKRAIIGFGLVCLLIGSVCAVVFSQFGAAVHNQTMIMVGLICGLTGLGIMAGCGLVIALYRQWFNW